MSEWKTEGNTDEYPGAIQATINLQLSLGQGLWLLLPFVATRDLYGHMIHALLDICGVQPVFSEHLNVLVCVLPWMW